jgi:hypothetical protein
MKQFVVQASWDPEAAVWWGTNDELPLTTEAATFDQLVSRVLEIGSEMAVVNGHAQPNELVEIRVLAERTQAVTARTSQ